MNPVMIIGILRMLLCNDEMMAWMEKESSKSSTPIDDIAVKLIGMLLCGKS